MATRCWHRRVRRNWLERLRRSSTCNGWNGTNPTSSRSSQFSHSILSWSKRSMDQAVAKTQFLSAVPLPMCFKSHIRSCKAVARPPSSETTVCVSNKKESTTHSVSTMFALNKTSNKDQAYIHWSCSRKNHSSSLTATWTRSGWAKKHHQTSNTLFHEKINMS